ncbi:hypothetical protein [Mucisphaera calidilacus]|uniref:Uncharacterized protein n=1 Tax=Mucisphaera calidilacus TaxID=2527982 RepID=A0A518C0T3_9BACT|nr:hypothetical protein [Mucisphaera calidilacus]QDU72804.1 hypothetical protein Pan265_26780 [Mucisphaera calidilacus]
MDEVVHEGDGVVDERVLSLERERDALAERLSASEAAVGRLERRAALDALLADSEVVDLEAARLLTEAAVEQMDEADLAMAVEDLRRHRPYLFRCRGVDEGQGVMGEEPEGGPVEAARRARASGHRRDLLAYLRLRRSR